MRRRHATHEASGSHLDKALIEADIALEACCLINKLRQGTTTNSALVSPHIP
jgi:hypothetical protein